MDNSSIPVGRIIKAEGRIVKFTKDKAGNKYEPIIDENQVLKGYKVNGVYYPFENEDDVRLFNREK